MDNSIVVVKMEVGEVEEGKRGQIYTDGRGLNFGRAQRSVQMMFYRIVYLQFTYSC